MTLEDYVRSGITLEIDNGQTRLIAGEFGHLGAFGYIGYGKCTDELLVHAKRNINEAFSVVGLAERFDETLLLMKGVLGWVNPPFYQSENVSLKKFSLKNIAKSTVQVIEKYNSLDCELYEYAAKNFQKTLDDQDYFTIPDLMYFKVKNKLYQML